MKLHAVHEKYISEDARCVLSNADARLLMGEQPLSVFQEASLMLQSNTC